MSEVTQCEKFVRNAWKKELCSNCFKAKEDHPEKVPAPIAVHAKLPDPPKEGILKGSKTTRTKKNGKVIFPLTEYEVIGYGGDDVYSEDEEELDIGINSYADEPDTEQDRALQKLTKANTDFNSMPANLQRLETNEPLQLGKQLTDEKGKKKTLLVSVTPFGAASGNNGVRGGASVNVNSPRTPLKSSTENNLEDQGSTDLKSDVTENGDTKRESPTSKITVPKVVEVGIKRSQPVDKNSKFRLIKELNENTKNIHLEVPEENRVVNENKLNEKLTTSNKVANLLDKARKKVHSLPVIGDTPHFKFKAIDFSPTSNRKASLEKDKEVVLNVYDLRKDEETLNLTGGQVPLPETNGLTSHVKITPTIVFETKKVDEVKDSVLNSISISSLHKSTPLKIEMTPLEGSELVVTKANDLTKTDVPTTEDCSTENSVLTSKEGVLCDKLDNYEGIIGDEEVTVFSLESLQTESKLETEEGNKSREVVHIPVNDDDNEACDEEPPALPTSSPPSIDQQVSFLHQLAGSKLKPGEKPKVPAKPTVIPNKKQPFRIITSRPKSPSRETFLDSPVTQLPAKHCHVAETLSDTGKKRPAPQPPSPRDSCSVLRAALSSEDLLELSTCSDDITASGRSPTPAPRRSLSLSQDCLLSSGVCDVQAKKKSNRGKFSLRKFLHLGKNKEGGKEGSRREYRIEGLTEYLVSSPRPKPKPEIIHPLDLTGVRLEVVPHRSMKTRRRSSSGSSSSGEQRESDVLSDSSASQSVSSSGNSAVSNHNHLDLSKKPPPPPRKLSMDQTDKPARPPPPKSVISRKRDAEESPSISSSQDNVYVNIGEVRSGLAPHKPVRTGSLREVDVKKLSTLPGCEALNVKKQYWTGSLRGPPKGPPPEDSGYESFDVSLTTTDSSSQISSLTTEENLYECVQAPSQLGCPPEHSRSDRTARSESNVPDGGSEYIKFRFLRSVSMPHCSSETESDIYSPYSFCASEMGEDDYEWSPTSGHFQKVSRLKMKKGRSIVHKNLEDNYGAVIVANHEALMQVVEQMNQGPVIPPALRSLTSTHNLRWTDFSVVKGSSGVTVERRTFYPALWGLNPVTLCLAAEQSVSSLHGKSPFSLHPLTELHDLVPSDLLPEVESHDAMLQCSISVLSRIQIETLANYCRSVSNLLLTDDLKKEIHFVLLQTINALKALQAAGIEEASRGLLNVVLCREDRDPYPRVCFLPSTVNEGASLCVCLLDLIHSLPATDLSPLLVSTLCAEKAVSLSQAKALLEFTLWGPADITFGCGGRSRGDALQRWLDLERASVLHGLVRTRTDLSVFEEWHLLFLVHTNAKVLADASIMLETSSVDC